MGCQDKKRPIRLIGVGTVLSRARGSFHCRTPSEKERKLLDAVDDLKNRFGESIKGNAQEETKIISGEVRRKPCRIIWALKIGFSLEHLREDRSHISHHTQA